MTSLGNQLQLRNRDRRKRPRGARLLALARPPVSPLIPRGAVAGRDAQARVRRRHHPRDRVRRDRAGRARVVRRRGAAVACVPVRRDPGAARRGGEHLSPQPARARGRLRPAADRPIRVLESAGAAAQDRFTGSCGALGEALLAAAVAANVIVVGASFGAYGTRMLRAALPHGPVELAAYSLALVALPTRPQAADPGPTRARGRWRSASRHWRSPPCSRPT